MSITEAIADKVKVLPPSRQMEVLDFVEFLQQKSMSHATLRNPAGMFADPRFDLTLEDFQEARREAWKNFPREIG